MRMLTDKDLMNPRGIKRLKKKKQMAEMCGVGGWSFVLNFLKKFQKAI